jgi:biotin-(acetyl-CoA carboxylase) ligase
MSVPVFDVSPLLLPPPYAVWRRAGLADAFEEASALAPRRGAGTFVIAERDDILDFAVVLEPEQKLAEARLVFLAGMNALAIAVGSVCPPEKQVVFGWPDRLFYDGALLGGGRLGWPRECGEASVPAWLVFGASLIAAKDHAPGLTPHSTSLAEEGFGEDAPAILESFARHLMASFDDWHDRGFDPIAAHYRSYLDVAQRASLGANGDFITKEGRRSLAEALTAPGWRDPVTKAPRL